MTNLDVCMCCCAQHSGEEELELLGKFYDLCGPPLKDLG